MKVFDYNIAKLRNPERIPAKNPNEGPEIDMAYRIMNVDVER